VFLRAAVQQIEKSFLVISAVEHVMTRSKALLAIWAMLAASWIGYAFVQPEDYYDYYDDLVVFAFLPPGHFAISRSNFTTDLANLRGGTLAQIS
jgi:hypothetical protein